MTDDMRFFCGDGVYIQMYKLVCCHTQIVGADRCLDECNNRVQSDDDDEVGVEE